MLGLVINPRFEMPSKESQYRMLPFVLADIRDELQRYLVGLQEDNSSAVETQIRVKTNNVLMWHEEQGHLEEWTFDQVLLHGAWHITIDFVALPDAKSLSWSLIQELLSAHSRDNPNVYIHIHREEVPPGCTSPFKKQFEEIYALHEAAEKGERE